MTEARREAVRAVSRGTGAVFSHFGRRVGVGTALFPFTVLHPSGEAMPPPERDRGMLPEDFYKLGRVVRSGRLSELLTKEFLI